MVAAAWEFTEQARTFLLDGTINTTDTFRMALFLATSNLGPSSTLYSGLTNEHANANGYTTGGLPITLTLSGLNPVKVDILTDPVWTAAGGSIVARYAAIYEVGGNVLCYSVLDDTPADVVAPDGQPFIVAAHADGVFTF